MAQSFGAPDEPLLPLDKGRTSARAFDWAVGEYVQTFTFDRVASTTLDHIRSASRCLDIGASFRRILNGTECDHPSAGSI